MLMVLRVALLTVLLGLMPALAVAQTSPAQNHEQQEPAERQQEQRRIEGGPYEAELSQDAPALQHPMPRRVRDNRGEDDGSHAFGQGIAKEKLQHRNQQNENQQLAQLDSNVERKQGREKVRPGKLQRLPQRK